MGANNSTPETVRIENAQSDSPQMPLTGKQQLSSAQVVEEMPHNWNEDRDFLKRQYKELEEYQFDRSIEKVKSMIGKPLMWEEDVNETIINLRHDLIKCYRDHPKQPLTCSDQAMKYHNFIFREQYRTILKFCEQHEDSGISSAP